MRFKVTALLMVCALGVFVVSDGFAAGEAAGGATPAAGGQERQLDPKLPGVGDQEQEFASSAHALLRPLVDMSRLGADRASDSELAGLSEAMAAEYTNLLRELEQAARSAGVDAEKGEVPHGQNRLNRLQISGGEFDLAYAIEQQGLHEKLVDIYGMEARAEPADALVKHAQSGQEVLGKNLAKIEQIHDRLREARTSPMK